MTIRSSPHGDRTVGQALVEFALLLPVLLLIFFAIFDFGRAVYAYNTIANAARQAARVAIVDQDLLPIQDKGVFEGLALGLARSDVEVMYCQSTKLCGPGEADAGATCVPSNGGIAIGCDAVVTVTYTYTAATPAISALVGAITMSSTTRLAVERTYGDGGTNP
jgi:Flp pilus assembly protein TadG